mmetsp:Transcript_34587/g.110458  ORF Transcript_34587/g.110458 Transcript_34587/m.110458 type:complete len:257 (-) Transcript_34587:970-1740(-)
MGREAAEIEGAVWGGALASTTARSKGAALIPTFAAARTRLSLDTSLPTPGGGRGVRHNPAPESSGMQKNTHVRRGPHDRDISVADGWQIPSRCELKKIARSLLSLSLAFTTVYSQASVQAQGLSYVIARSLASLCPQSLPRLASAPPNAPNRDTSRRRPHPPPPLPHLPSPPGALSSLHGERVVDREGHRVGAAQVQRLDVAPLARQQRGNRIDGGEHILGRGGGRHRRRGDGDGGAGAKGWSHDCAADRPLQRVA